MQQIYYDLSKVKALKNLQKRQKKKKNPHGYAQGEKVRVRFENGSYMRIEVCVRAGGH